MIVSLVGLRGAGKTTIGRDLARRLGWPAFDLDQEIERRTSRTVPQWFAEHGEPAFRAAEADILAELLEQDPAVLSTGGGAVVTKANRAALRAAGPVVWLTAPPEALRARIAAEGAAVRPALTPAGTLSEIEALAAERAPFYREVASIEVSTDGRSTGEVVDEIVARLGLDPLDPGAEA